MNTFRRYIKTVPLWAFILVLLAVIVNTLYFIYRYQTSVDGQSNRRINGKPVISHVAPGGAADNAGILPGDTLVTVDGMDVHEWSDIFHDVRAGDTCYYGVIRDGQILELPVVFTSPITFFYGFSVTFFILPLLIHFHLIFPVKAKIISTFRILPWLFYLAGIVFFIICQVYYMKMLKGDYLLSEFYPIKQNTLTWLTGNYFLTVGIVIYQYITIRDTLSRNQLRLVITGTFFGIYTAVLLVFFMRVINHISAGYPYFIILAQGTGGMIMIAFILIALFRFRIWDINIIIRKTLQYLAATLLIFLLLRDWLQRMIHRPFHRESYDSAAVVSDFEEEMTGGFRVEDLGSRIVDRIDKIFHFKSVLLFLKKERNRYEPAFVMGDKEVHLHREFKISREFEDKLFKKKMFSPGELSGVPVIPGTEAIKLVVPMVSDGKPFGFFLCGPKKSEKSYSLQDIRFLTLIAKRVIALFNTAALYQKDLDRQLMLERERARISQDMHDDVGASLTRREEEILGFLVKGYFYKEITGELFISTETVRTHIRNIYEKLHVRTRSAAILKFLRK